MGIERTSVDEDPPLIMFGDVAYSLPEPAAVKWN